MRNLWVSLAGRAAALIDRLLHPLRRRSAAARLASGPRPRSVVFVCKGDLDAGPFAAACLHARIAEMPAMQLRITSAGFVRPGRTPPPETQRCARRYSIDLQRHRSQLIAALSIGEWDLFVVTDPVYGDALRRRYGLDPARVLVLGDFDPQAIAQRAIPDLNGHSTGILEASYARVDRCTRALAAALVSLR